MEMIMSAWKIFLKYWTSLNWVTKKFQGEKDEDASDEDLIRLGVTTIGDRTILREGCRRIYTANSSLRPLDISQ